MEKKLTFLEIKGVTLKFLLQILDFSLLLINKIAYPKKLWFRHLKTSPRSILDWLGLLLSKLAVLLQNTAVGLGILKITVDFRITCLAYFKCKFAGAADLGRHFYVCGTQNYGLWNRIYSS